MDPETRKRWLAAVNTLALDPSATVECPFCSHAELRVKDVPAGINHIDREIWCTACGWKGAMYMKVDAPHHEPSFADRALPFMMERLKSQKN